MCPLYPLYLPRFAVSLKTSIAKYNSGEYSANHQTSPASSRPYVSVFLQRRPQVRNSASPRPRQCPRGKLAISNIRFTQKASAPIQLFRCAILQGIRPKNRTEDDVGGRQPIIYQMMKTTISDFPKFPHGRDSAIADRSSGIRDHALVRTPLHITTETCIPWLSCHT